MSKLLSIMRDAAKNGLGWEDVYSDLRARGMATERDRVAIKRFMLASPALYAAPKER